MTTLEASDALQCTPQHVRLLIRQGKICGAKRGRDWFADRASVAAYEGYPKDRSKSVPAIIKEQRRLFNELELQPVVNVSTVPQRSPFRYPGGKTWLIPVARQWLNSLSSKPKLLVEPFAGGGGIGLMAAFEHRVDQALLIELDPDVASVWRSILNGHSQELCDRILSFACTPEDVKTEFAKPVTTDLDHAFQTILRNRVSRGGILAPGAGLVKKGEANKGIASRWYPETLATRIRAIKERNNVISFEESDGLTVVQQYAGDSNTAFFVDPPYPIAGQRLYRCHELDHRRLFALLNTVQGAFLATYDHNPQIEELALEFRFYTKLIPMKSTHHARKLELLISRDPFEWLE